MLQLETLETWCHSHRSPLPIVLNSVNPRLIQQGKTIAALRTEENESIVEELA
jgi:hypothetical protein